MQNRGRRTCTAQVSLLNKTHITYKDKRKEQVKSERHTKQRRNYVTKLKEREKNKNTKREKTKQRDKTQTGRETKASEERTKIENLNRICQPASFFFTLSFPS